MILHAVTQSQVALDSPGHRRFLSFLPSMSTVVDLYLDLNQHNLDEGRGMKDGIHQIITYEACLVCLIKLVAASIP